MTTLTEEAMLKLAKTYEATLVTRINLSNQQLINIDIVNQLININFVNITNNQIQDISMLFQLQNVQSIVADNNNIQQIKVAQENNTLTYLSLKNNKIGDQENLRQLKNCKQLLTLNMQGNECCKQPEYLKYVMMTLQSIRTLNGIRVRLCNGEIVAIPSTIPDDQVLVDSELTIKKWVDQFGDFDIKGFDEEFGKGETTLRTAISGYWADKQVK